MANTKIQIKRSTVTAAPPSLDIGELAYSYSANTLYIGNTGGTGVIAIGGASLGIGANAYAITVGAASNTWANSVGTAGNNYTNAVGTAGNNYAIQVGAASNVWANAVGTAGNNYTNAVGVAGNNYAIQVGAASNTWANGLYTSALASSNNAANSANAYGTATFYAKSGGTISGDVVVTGNLTVSGLTTYTNTNTLLVGDNIVTLNADLPGTAAPTENAGIEVNRGNANANSAIFWNETTDKWQISSNLSLGSTWLNIASNTDVENYAAAGNSYAIQIGAASNTWANSVGTAGNNYTNAVGASSNAWANTKVSSVTGTAGQIFSSGGTTPTLNLVNTGVTATTYGGAAQVPVFTVDGQGRLTFAANVSIASMDYAYVNTYANGTANSANAYAAQIVGYANTNAANGSYINTGIVKVPYGGTGNTTFLANSVLIGAGANAIWGLQSTTEGHLLQISSAGAPQFAMLDGGAF